MDTKRTKSRGLVGEKLERALMRLAYTNPDLVSVRTEINGELVTLRGAAVRKAPRKRGNYSTIDSDELRELWPVALERLRVQNDEFTDLNTATVLSDLTGRSVSAKTVSRYRDRDGLDYGPTDPKRHR